MLIWYYLFIRVKKINPRKKEKKVPKKKAPKKVSKKENQKQAIARKNLVSNLVEKFDLVENAQKKFDKENSKNFRIASIAIYEALNTKSVFKSVRDLAEQMGRSKSDVGRYAQAGKFLKGVTDEQLEKVGFNAYKVKTELRKIKSSLEVKTAEDLKNASEKVKGKKNTPATLTIDIALSFLKSVLENGTTEQAIEIKKQFSEMMKIENKKEKAAKNLILGYAKQPVKASK